MTKYCTKNNPGICFQQIAFVVATMLLLSLGFPVQGWSYPRRDAVVTAVETVSPAVVNISSEYEVERQVNPFQGFGISPHFDSFFKDFFDHGYEQRYKRNSLGSGVIIDGRRGYILTNAHVIVKSATITVTLKDEREFKAQVIGADPETDLAVLRIVSDASLPAIAMGNSDDLMIGETVIAIGNPFGFTNTVTTGVISAVNRSIKAEDRVFHDFIQTDASINPGNSGGPLLNINGELIGINTAIYANAQGIGFAIPINKARRIVNDLIRFGEVIQAWTGIDVQDLDHRLASYLNLADNKGVVVIAVEPESPARQAGMLEGDIILAVADRKIESLEQYQSIINGIPAGETVPLMLLRQGKQMTVTLETRAYPIENADKLAEKLLGVRVMNRSGKPPGSRPSPAEGVEITDIRRNSYLDRIGVRPGDVIRQIDEINIRNLADFHKAIIKYRLKKSLVILLQRGGRGYYLSVEL
ncbi:MAG: Do family serine endopeptidase [Thermodesulfobacteriota bacterium]